MAQVRLKSVQGKLPQSLADSVRAFAVANPMCEDPTYSNLYISTLTAALLVDAQPSSALLREYHALNGRLRKEILKIAADKEESIEDLINRDSNDSPAS
jgi:hypothetical protein